MDEHVGKRRRPVMSEMVAGEPIQVGERRLVPLVQVTTRGRRRALLGAARVTGEGWGFVRLRPVAVLERSEEGERRLPIQDRTAQWLGGFLLAAFIVPLLLGVAVRLASSEPRKDQYDTHQETR